MKKRYAFVFLSALFATFLLASPAHAQGGEPPPCCNGSGAPMIRSLFEGEQTEGAANQIQVSEDAIQLLGVTRSQFIDRISDGLFPGRTVSLVLSKTRLISQQPLSPKDEGLLFVQEKSFYQISRSRLSSQEIDTLDQLYLTDGEVYIKVTFTRREPAAQGR